MIPADEAVAEIRVAVEVRPTPDFRSSRTDARYAEGLDAALRRAERFLEAGADILFVESRESLEELRRVAETFPGATLLANMVEGGRTPYLGADELADMGFKVALYPGTAFLAAARALQMDYGHLRATGIGTGGPAPMLPFPEMNTPMGFPAVHAFEARHGFWNRDA